MATKTKTYDCVEAKHRCQRRLQEEFEERKDEFASYYDFLDSKTTESEWVRKIRRQVPMAKNAVSA